MTPLVVSRFDRLLYGVASAFVVVLLLTVTAGIVSRALGHPFSWTDEASGFLMVWLACLGWMIATRRGVHIRIRFFQNMLRAQPWRWTESLIQIGMALLGAVIAWNSIHLMRVNSDVEAMTLPISTAWMYAALLPAGLMTFVQAISDLWRLLRGDPRALKPVAEGLV